MLSHPSECAYLIPAEGERRKTNKLLGQARDLIAKSKRAAAITAPIH